MLATTARAMALSPVVRVEKIPYIFNAMMPSKAMNTITIFVPVDRFSSANAGLRIVEKYVGNHE